MSESTAARSTRAVSPPPWLHRALAIIPFLTILLLAWRGVDFGAHWDEDANKISGVIYSLEHDVTLLPEGYIYPGVNYWLTIAALTPEIRDTLKKSGPSAVALRDALLPVLRSDAFHLRLRRIYATIAALAAAWLYFGILVWDGRWWQALAGSMLFATSWEIIYHARWIAPDEVLMQFGALTFWLVGLAWKKQRAWAGTAAAISAGLACGTKYPGALIFLPVFLLPFLQITKRAETGRAAVTALRFCVYFSITYLLTTPGTLLQPLTFLASQLYSKKAYADGWYGYTVTPGWGHFGKLLFYFSNSLFSAFRPLAWCGAGLALIGLGATLQRGWRESLLVLIFPITYLAFFSEQATMVVRNSLIVAPFFFLFLARGLNWISDRISNHRLAYALMSMVGLVIIADGVDQFNAGSTIIRRRNDELFVWDLVRYLDANPDKKILVSERVEKALSQINVWPRRQLTPKKGNDKTVFDLYASYYNETLMPYELEWQTNRPGSFTAVFGPRDVNLDYYSGWHGSDRIILMSPEQIEASRIPTW